MECVAMMDVRGGLQTAEPKRLKEEKYMDKGGCHAHEDSYSVHEHEHEHEHGTHSPY